MIDTHYCYRPPVLDAETFRSFSRDVAKLVAAAARPRVNARGFDGTGEPIITDDRIVLNGDAEAGQEHEPLVIERVFQGRVRDRLGFFFCKTNGKPYDLLVVAALYAFVRWFPAARFRTDSRSAELADGFDLFRNAICPELPDSFLNLLNLPFGEPLAS